MTWDDAARLAPIATSSIAALTLSAAVVSILVQKAIARRRAAIDFFLKTELDKELLNAYSTFNLALERVSTFETTEDLARSSTYVELCDYLAVHEVMALGVRNKVFDERICYAFWCQVLQAAAERASPVIDYVRRQPYGSRTYDDLLWLHRRWSGRRRFWQRWRHGLKRL